MRPHLTTFGRFFRRAWRLVPAAVLSLAVVLGVLGIATRDSNAAGSPVDGHRRHARTNRGDATRGERLFQDRLRCLHCHGEFGAGGNVGPDLQGIGGRHDRDYLITAVLEPSKQLAPSFGTISITTVQGLPLTGRFIAEDAETIAFVDDLGQKHVVAKSEIESRQVSSRMPDNLHRRMTPEEFADLIAFLEAQR